MNIVNIDQGKILKYLATLNVSKSQGPDVIHSVIVKLLATVLAGPLNTLHGESLQSDIPPKDWMEAIVTPNHIGDRRRSSSCVSPIVVLREVRNTYPVFGGYAQHDAQEFLRVFLNHLHGELKVTNAVLWPTTQSEKLEDVNHLEKKRRNCTCEQPKTSKRSRGKSKLNTKPNHGTCSCSKQPNNSTSSDSDLAFSTTLPRTNPAGSDGRSIITDVFQGKLVSAVRCLSCKQVSCREEVFLDLSLSLRRPETDRVPAGTTVYGASSPSPSSSLSLPALPEANGIPQTSDRPKTKPVVREKRRAATASTTLDTRRQAQSRASGTDYAPLQQLGPLWNTVPQTRAMIVQLISFIALSITWVFSRLAGLSEWITQPRLSLEDCLSEYFSLGELYGENQYYCERCKKLCDGVNQTALVSLPEVLCIHLKRFRSHCMDSSKVTASVKFPLEGLDLKPYIHPDCSDKVTTYDLSGVICHSGGLSGGHYVACAYNQYQQAWYEFDDDHVAEVASYQVEQLTSAAYILFYRKRETQLLCVRNEANALLRDQLHFGSSRTVYISRPWFVRFCNTAEPGPISNTEFLCNHGLMHPQFWIHRESVLFAIPEELWVKLVTEFGGGPPIQKPVVCPTCRDTIVARARDELLAYEQASDYSEPIAESCGRYAISARWFESWKNFVEGTSFRVPNKIDNADIADYRSLRYPFNNMLASSRARSNTGGVAVKPNPRLKVGIPYRELYPMCWEVLLDRYGGGPTICLRAPVILPIVQSDTEDEKEADEAHAAEEEEEYDLTNAPSPILSKAAMTINDDDAIHQASMITSISNPETHHASVHKTSDEEYNGDAESGVYLPNDTSTLPARHLLNGTHSSHCAQLDLQCSNEVMTDEVSYLSASAENLISSNPKGDSLCTIESGYSSTAPSLNHVHAMPQVNGHSNSHSIDRLQSSSPMNVGLELAGDGPNADRAPLLVRYNGCQSKPPVQS